ncbi:hypothetical protein NLJ89_g1945 [Agrocybe chaxingu]|uniref:Uncharacterized protein n=1 Tax=Agrocybe chaxingu TaxID=84603 RepID=A0A9W8MZ28_9AGAR|nr:hypothetical protein NLJ89_g1945 [Agrocybe chaxingu]
MDSSSPVSCLFPGDSMYPSPQARVKKPHIANDNRRHAAYYPSKASLLGAKRRRSEPVPSLAPTPVPFFDEEESTWEFSAPLQAPSLSSSSCSSCESSGSRSSAAQLIALEYRLRHLEADGAWARDDFFDFEYVSVYPPSPKTSEHDNISHTKKLSQHDEAVTVMKSHHPGPDSRVVCQRPGCRETLEDFKDLMYHLHLHDTIERSVTCPRCNGYFDTQREMSMHDCRRRPHSAPSSPVRDGFFRVLNKIVSHI